MEYSGEGTVAMRGSANLVFVCGGCRAPIIDGVLTNQLHNLVFRCNGCGTYNETLDWEAALRPMS